MGADIAVFREFFRYNPDTRHRKRLILRLVRELAPFKSLLDLGCGDGSLCEAIAEAFPGARVVGADLSEAAIAAARARGGRCEYVALDATQGRLPENFEVVVSSEVLEHIDQDGLAVEGIRAMCGRYLLVTVPGGPMYQTSQLMGHHRHYTPESLTRLIESRGFRVKRLFRWGFPFHSLYRWAINLRARNLWGRYTQDRYSASQIALCHALYALFFLNSSRAGNQLYCLAEVVERP